MWFSGLLFSSVMFKQYSRKNLIPVNSNQRSNKFSGGVQET